MRTKEQMKEDLIKGLSKVSNEALIETLRSIFEVQVDNEVWESFIDNEEYHNLVVDELNKRLIGR